MKLIYSVFLAVLIVTPVFSCECLKLTCKFIDDFKHKNFVGLIEVVGADTADWYYHSEFVRSETYVRAKLLRQYKGGHIGHNVLIKNAEGFLCETSLSSDKLGTKYIIKGFASKKIKELRSDLDTSILFITLSMCDNSQLELLDNVVEGWINKCPPRKYAKWSEFWRIVSFGLIKRREKDSFDFKRQKMSFEEIDELLINALN